MKTSQVATLGGLAILAYLFLKPKAAEAAIVASSPSLGDPVVTPGGGTASYSADPSTQGKTIVDAIVNPEKYVTTITVSPTGVPTATYPIYIEYFQKYLAMKPKTTPTVQGFGIVMDVSPADRIVSRNQALAEMKSKGMTIPFNPAPQDFINAWLGA